MYSRSRNKQQTSKERRGMEKVTVYHGTNNLFSKFADGITFFTADKETARTYGERIFQAEIQFEHELIFDFCGQSTYYFIDRWHTPGDLVQRLQGIRADIMNRYGIEEETLEELQFHGYDAGCDIFDGIILEDIQDSGGMFNEGGATTHYVVFSSKQAKRVKLQPTTTTTLKEEA